MKWDLLFPIKFRWWTNFVVLGNSLNSDEKNSTICFFCIFGLCHLQTIAIFVFDSVEFLLRCFEVYFLKKLTTLSTLVEIWFLEKNAPSSIPMPIARANSNESPIFPNFQSLTHTFKNLNQNKHTNTQTRIPKRYPMKISSNF